MQSDIQITNRNDTCFVDIEGVIGVPEEWQFDQPSSRVATYEKFRDSLDRLREIDAPEIVVNIRSTGGDVNDALLIYEALSSLDGHIVTRCYGYTAFGGPGRGESLPQSSHRPHRRDAAKYRPTPST